MVSLALHADNRSALAEDTDYLRDIRPILADNCFACHGADENSREADLRLDVAPKSEVALRAIAPGDPEASELIARITSSDPELVMPPLDSEAFPCWRQTSP